MDNIVSLPLLTHLLFIIYNFELQQPQQLNLHSIRSKLSLNGMDNDEGNMKRWLLRKGEREGTKEEKKNLIKLTLVMTGFEERNKTRCMRIALE